MYSPLNTKLIWTGQFGLPVYVSHNHTALFVKSYTLYTQSRDTGIPDYSPSQFDTDNSMARLCEYSNSKAYEHDVIR